MKTTKYIFMIFQKQGTKQHLSLQYSLHSSHVYLIFTKKKIKIFIKYSSMQEQVFKSMINYWMLKFQVLDNRYLWEKWLTAPIFTIWVMDLLYGSPYSLLPSNISLIILHIYWSNFLWASYFALLTLVRH